jgi:hypothetical protein
MRVVIFAVILGLMLPMADASGPKGACKDRCSSMYEFCLKNARTKQMRATCKADRKTCKGQCR